MTDTSERCNDCSLGRRAFLRAGARAAAVVAAIAATGGRAGAMPVRFISAVAFGDKEATYAIPAGDSVNIDHDKDIILARAGTSLYAFDLSCPHQNTALRWSASDRRFECPRHHSKYSADGIYIEGRATRSMDRHAVRRDGNNIVVDLDTSYEQVQDAAQWKAAFLAV
jgi:nitrite reductase/ring-hydroxylating ferredoxin subunit